MKEWNISPVAMTILFSIVVPAQASVTVSFGDWYVQPESSIEIPIMITTDSADEINGVDLYVTVGDGNTGPAPFATAIEMISHLSLPDPIFGAVSSTQVTYGDPWEVFPGNSQGFGGSSTGLKSATAVYANATSGPNADVPAEGVLAYVEFSTAGVPAGVYNVKLENDELFGASLMVNIAGVMEPGRDYFLVPGMITVTPEPSSVLLGSFAAVSLSVLCARRYRARQAAQ
jgi:hypothetical protein